VLHVTEGILYESEHTYCVFIDVDKI